MTSAPIMGRRGSFTFPLAWVNGEEQELETREATPNQVGILHKAVLNSYAVEPPQSRDQEGGQDEGEGQGLSTLRAEHFSEGDQGCCTEDHACYTAHQAHFGFNFFHSNT